MRVLKTFNYIRYFFAAILVWLAACRDTPRDNPFDPETEVLLVRILSPRDSSEYLPGDTVFFRVSARTGYDDLPAGDTFLWSSDLSGPLSGTAEFTSDSLPEGTHRITVSVSDSRNRHGSAAVTVTVLKVPHFGVIITNPPGDTTFIIGSELRPAAREYVPRGSTVIGRLWSFGAGSGLEDTPVRDPGIVLWSRAGEFRLVYQIVDNLGRTAADTVVVNVLAESRPPIVVIVVPSVDTTIAVYDSLRLEAVEIKTTAPIARRSWIYPPGSGLESLHDSLPAPGWRRFGRPGIFEVVYGVTDSYGVPAADTVVITVNDTTPPPLAELVAPAGDTAIVAGDSLRFEGRFTPAQALNISQSWDYGAGSGLDATGDTLAVPGYRTFSLAGEFRVRYTVTDLSGRSSSDSLRVTVAANRTPLAKITAPAADTSVGRGAPVLFQATDSDPEDRELTRLWTWGASGIAPSAADSLQRAGTKIFDTPGTFTIRYRVTDDKGVQASDSLRFTVTANEFPTANITLPSADTTAYTGDSLLLEETSSDDGAIAVRAWSLRSPDGSLQDLESSGAPFYLRFDTEGSYRLYLTVTDNQGASARDSLLVIVFQRPPNQPPTANILTPAADSTIYAWTVITFSAEDFDPEERIVARSWSFGAASGIPSDEETGAVTGPKTFTVAGTFTVTYTVTDDRGASASDSLILNVLANSPPIAVIIFPERTNSIGVGDSLLFVGLESDPGGRVASRWWDYGAGSGLPPDSVLTPAYRQFNNAGTFEVILTTVDDVGASRRDSVIVRVGVGL